MAANIPYCLLCAATITNCKNRRNVSYGEGLTVREVIREFLINNRVRSSDAEPTEAVELYMKSSNVVCKQKCFPLISKLIKLQQDIKGIRDELEKTVQNSYMHFERTHGGGSRKRSSSLRTPSPHKRLIRELANTPTRQFLSTTMVDNEAVVAVISSS